MKDFKREMRISDEGILTDFEKARAAVGFGLGADYGEGDAGEGGDDGRDEGETRHVCFDLFLSFFFS